MPIKINGTNTAANPSITGTDTDTGIVYGSDQIDFSTGGSSKLTLNGQNLGLGTSSPNVSGFNTDAQVLTLAGNYRGFIELKGNTQAADSIGGIRFYSANNLEAEIVSRTDSSYNGDLRFNTNGSERMRLLSSGGMTFNGDTAAANAISDYEEGYWSPTAMDGIPITTNNTGNHPSRRYIKIGKIVFAYFDFTFGNQFNAFGARFGGLPITVASGGGHGANASTNGYTNLQQEYFLHVSGTNPAIFKSNGAQFTHNEVSSKRFAGCIIYSTD